ncbi:amidohydrolase [Microbacterium sp. RD1]|uniref:amidohydrolase n=1 Tax=Microbacterium sp. RD1 TaxID=3457313 RepID=UPI003FA6098E
MTALLIRNARLWSAGFLAGDAVAIRDGRIAAIGDAAEISIRGADELDARGGLVTPGFVDAHLHLGIAAVDAVRCDVTGMAGITDVAARVREFAAASEAAWVVGGGWEPTLFPPSGPTASALDALVPDRPAFLLNVDHHGAWVNSAALRLAGIDATTPDPADGRIERLPDGTPSGMLHEGAAQLVARILPPPDLAALAGALARRSADLHAVGITGWQEAALGEYGGLPDFTAAYHRALGAGALRGRATGAIWVPRDLDEDGIDAFVAHCVQRREDNRAAGFPTGTAKLMLDGIVESRTAAVLAPYLDGGEGLSYFSPSIVERLIPALNAARIAVHVHAIGDRATRIALDGFARAAEPDRARVRNHIAHLQLIDPADIPRFSALGVTANVQPFWACETALMREQTLPALGRERVSRMYAFAALRDAGAALAMGSDWPVSSLDPWQGIAVGVTRRPAGEPDATPLGPAQALPLAVALEAYTRGSAVLLGLEGGGELRVGSPADLAIADRDPFGVPVEELAGTRNAATVLAGEIVFGG